jgi:hypothetical protein
MTDDRLDLSQLQPRDHEALVRAIESRAASLLAERRARTATIQIAAWWRPVAAAAFLIAVASALAFTLEPRSRAASTLARSPSSAPSAHERTELARMLGVPPALALSLTRDTPPTARELFRELGR